MSQNQTVLVTGGVGFIGSHTVIELISSGYEVVILDNLVNANMECLKRMEKILNQSLVFHEVDLTNKKEIDDIFKKYKIDHVIHFAALKAVGESVNKPLVYYQNNLVSALNILEVMQDNGCYSLVFSSSCTVYGEPQFLPLTENHPTGGCTNPYGKSKYFIEQIMIDLCYAKPEWSICLLRYFNPVGAHASGMIGEDPNGVPANLMPFVAQVAIGRRSHVSVFGNDYKTRDGTGVRDYIHVVDLAKGHIKALNKLNEKCGLKIYNLGTGCGYSVLEMIQALEKVSGRSIRYEICDRRAGDLPELYADTTLAFNELGWKAEYDLEKMCQDLWNWQQNNPNGFNTK